jgi:predicted metal-dependent peptidase
MKESVSILLNYEPYLACLIQRCTTVYTDKVPTAAVRVMPGGVIELLINPEFFYNQSPEERVGLLWHEMYHLICDHINRSWGLDPRRANIAMDEAINQLIPLELLPKGALLPDYFKHERHKQFEVYYNLHMERDDAEKFQQPQAYKGGMDDKRRKGELNEQINKALDKQSEISKKQEELQSKQDAQKPDGDKSDVKSKESQIAKNQDQQESDQDTLTERLQGKGMQQEAEKSEDLTSAAKDVRKRMEKLADQYPEKGNKDVSDQQGEMADLQSQMKASQQEVENALNELDQIQKDQQARDADKSGKGGQKGEPGSGSGEPGQGDGSGPGGGDDTPHVLDNHDMWHTSPATKEEQKRGLTNVLVQAMHDAERQWGKKSIPAELRQMLEESMKKPKVNWKQLIRNFTGRCLVSDQLYSRKKPSRKFGYLVPGKVQKFGPKVIIAIDCSGSVGTDEYISFMTEFKGFTSHISEKIEVVFFDTELSDQKIMIDQSFRDIPVRPKMGGTDFQCVIDYANEQHPDLLVILTDGAAPCPTKPRCKVLWGIVGGRVNPELKFGQQVLIELDENKQNAKVYNAGA